ncbi:chemotaxis protein CheX [Trichloromonas sp.]|uniref:chemotaxis protein CheX n=1 Tax=Trichloromonas sp. TaxID=3069249 RepID=UPI002A43743F|nr:chemotaxis protein CheX [Trichloromonas sp.]
MSWDTHIADATVEIFSTMLMMEVNPLAPLTERIKTHQKSVTGIVGMAGLYKGMLAIHAPATAAMAITGNFLGLEVDDVNDDVKDAMGELANMLAGSIKAKLSDNSKDIQLSIPSAVCGGSYSLDYQPQQGCSMVPFESTAGRFLVELQLEQQT